jgi:apolipoprotein D and lipocalin family protein
MRFLKFRMSRPLLGLGLALAAAAACADVTVGQTAARPIDPQRYIGRWYEVARLPNHIQQDCVVSTSDWSRNPDGQFQVVQTCHLNTPDGPTKIWRGAGRIVDPITNALFRIGYFGGFVHMDYRVMDRGDDYSWCILTNGNPKYLWIMSRRPIMSAGEKTALIARARQLGFNVNGLIYDQQPGA